jgi:MYXO-CTERM domain-containing protein
MNRKRRNQLMFWLGVGCAVPFAYASTYAVNGAPRAEGCSGEAGEVDVGVLSLWAQTEEAAVGRDAFFTFQGSTNEIEPAEALAAITVTVTDEDGQLIAGAARILKQTDKANDVRTLLFGWTASGDTRAEGEVLSFHAQAMNSLDMAVLDARLVVRDRDPELQLPNFDIFEFDAALRDRGPREVCEGINECGSTRYGTELQKEVQMSLIAGGIDPGVLVAWEFHLEEISGKGNFAEPARTFKIEGFDVHEWLTFSDVLDEYCVRVVGHDWKTDTTKSSEVCASPEGEVLTTTYDGVGECYEPPAGLEERWCRSVASTDTNDWNHVSREQQDMCDRLLASGTSGAGGEAAVPAAGGAGPDEPVRGGSGGSSGSRGTTDPMPPQPPPLAGSGANGNLEPDAGIPADSEAGSANADAETKPSRIITEGGCGCRTASDPSGHTGALAFSGLLTLVAGLGLRRRRERRH